ncbi:hypothetical protein SAMN05444487_11839 [Marininema mesophilum]|uniref:Uncharacterized protein n=1 Tax=Marininema mesophilum TaxID=1048340 RepID=A0A1H3BUU2_9BACL|nr:hypothetical protein SAMN05444487_11839 [Marininema mesophilum]
METLAYVLLAIWIVGMVTDVIKEIMRWWKKEKSEE